MRVLRCSFLAAVVANACPLAATAQPRPEDALAALAEYRSLTKKDLATIEVEVIRRVQKLSSAKNDAEREGARKDLLDSLKLPGATKAFRDAYAAECSKQLRSLAADNDEKHLDTALSAVFVLVELDHPAACDAFADALGSPHKGVRFKAARGFQHLHAKLKGADTCRNVLAALGAAGAGETDPIVLRETYRAIDFSSSPGTTLKPSDDNGAALAAIFAARLQRLQQGSHDEVADLPGFAAAQACFAAAGAKTRVALLGAMCDFLTQAVDRYYDKQTSEGGRTTLAGVIRDGEAALRKMLSTAGGRAPRDEVGSLIRAKESEAKVRAALKGLDDAARAVR